ncbi:hypothetical protein BD410DRAFT_764388 [Rickenella mellea]|uniref:Uncharacterized protein n=1 Tax=Rickenella mellea TaxID=50990 RepID=A0A4Y7QFD4_9AGAM|nr:hypothetical protein BD410DRAFT_764388 [Rickenella mellea]
MSLALSIFLLVFVTELIAWVGKTVLVDFFYALYQRIFDSSRVKQQRELKTEILAAKAELLQTSSQDQFAKWAKLRRKVDKGLADLEKLNLELGSSKSAFSFRFNTGLWMMTTGTQFAIGWWYSRTAVFYLPPGWFGPVTWWLALPFAPAGSVSCAAWQMACRRVIKIGEGAVKEMRVGDLRREYTEEKGGLGKTE